MNRRKFERFAKENGLLLERLENDKRYASLETEWAWRGFCEATVNVDPVEVAHKADELYSAGYTDAKSGRDYDPRGCKEWQDVVDITKGEHDETDQ